MPVVDAIVVCARGRSGMSKIASDTEDEGEVVIIKVEVEGA